MPTINISAVKAVKAVTPDVVYSAMAGSAVVYGLDDETGFVLLIYVLLVAGLGGVVSYNRTKALSTWTMLQHFITAEAVGLVLLFTGVVLGASSPLILIFVFICSISAAPVIELFSNLSVALVTKLLTMLGIDIGDK